jgi:hypothetical protein
MEPTLFNHYLVSRFNLRRKGWNTTRKGETLLSEKWLCNRFRLFENFCLPSVQHQTNQNFTWLIFFDINTPQLYKNRAIEYGTRFPNLKPFFVEGMEQFLPEIQNEIQKSTLPYIITTRLDTDDCLRKDFTDEIQKNFNRQDFMCLDFPDGYTLQIVPKVRIGKRKQLYNPFTSLIEKNDTPQSVWCREIHSSWKRVKNVKRVSGVRIWMSVIHLENKNNLFAGFGFVDLKNVLNEFIIDNDTRKELLSKQTSVGAIESLRNRIRSQWRVLYKDIKRRMGIYKNIKSENG